MVRDEMRTDRRRIVTLAAAVALVAAIAVLVPIAGNASYRIGYWVGVQ